MKIKRWMVITGVLAFLGGTVALASCQSTASSGTITCTMEDCEDCDTENCTGDITTEEGCSQNCSGITYDCNGTDMNCSQFMCYGNVYNCWNTEDCSDCSWNCTDCITDCTATCVDDCTKENCQNDHSNNGGLSGGGIGMPNCSGASYVNRTLEKDVDYVITEDPYVFQRHTYPSASNDNAYNLYLTFHFNINLNVVCKNIEVEYVVYTYENGTRIEYTTKVLYETCDDFLNARASEEISIKNVPDSYYSSGFYVSFGTITADVRE